MLVAPRHITPVVIQSIQVLFQVVLYIGLFISAQCLTFWLHLPLPANLVGMILMLTLIACHVLPLQWARAGARWLLAEVLLFFVPAVMAAANYAQPLLMDGWRIFAVITLSTVMMLGTTTWVVEKAYRYEVCRLNRGQSPAKYALSGSYVSHLFSWQTPLSPLS